MITPTLEGLLIEKCKSLIAAMLCISLPSFSSRMFVLNFIRPRKPTIPELQYWENNRGFICKVGTTKSCEDNRGEERRKLEELLSYFNP